MLLPQWAIGAFLASVGFGLSLPANAEPLLGTAGRPVLIAKQSKSKKKKKSDSFEGGNESLGDSDGENTANGSGLHAKQGPDSAYTGEFGLLFGDFTTGNTETTPDGGDTAKGSRTDLDLIGEYMFIVNGRFGVGPVLQYNSQTETSDSVSVSSSGSGSTTTTEKTKSTYTSTKLGVGGKYYFGDLDRSKLVPYARLAFTIDSTSSKSGDSDASTASGNTITLAGGVNWFLAQHVALKAELGYEMENSSSKFGDYKSKEKSTKMGLNLGLAVFI